MRVLLAKVGLDGHDRGIKVLALTLRDAGHEVIYTGLHGRPDHIAQIAVDEDVDVVGLSVLSGAHLALTTEVLGAMRAAGAADVPVVVGGTVGSDAEALRALGVAEVFPTGTAYADIVRWFGDRRG